MSKKALKLSIQLPKSLSTFSEVIEQCHDFVLNNSFLKSDFKRLTRFKLVIMELLTNATKHGSNNCQIDIEVTNKQITVTKQDRDKTFTFKDLDTNQHYNFPLEECFTPKEIKALLGPNHVMSLNVLSNTEVEFLEPSFDEFLSIDHLPENFGLKVIRQCSDKFYYTYDKVNSLNLFVVIFENVKY